MSRHGTQEKFCLIKKKENKQSSNDVPMMSLMKHLLALNSRQQKKTFSVREQFQFLKLLGNCLGVAELIKRASVVYSSR